MLTSVTQLFFIHHFLAHLFVSFPSRVGIFCFWYFIAQLFNLYRGCSFGRWAVVLELLASEDEALLVWAGAAVH